MSENRTAVIAEMACSHDGSPDLAKVIIDGAGKAGADAIQLQMWTLQDMIAPDHQVYEVCKRIELSKDQWRDIVGYIRTRYPAMEIYVCVYEHKIIAFADSLGIDGYKLNSSDLSNPYVLDGVARTGKKINLSVGASTLTEIQSAIERIRGVSQAPLTLMYGYQSFPTSIKDIHLNYMANLKNLFGLPIGYQDHCDANTASAFWIPALAAGMGADVIEKHITHNRALKGVDHESALNPDEFVRFMAMVRELTDAKGLAVPRPFSADELKYRKFQKKSIVAAGPLKAGHKIAEGDIHFLRAAQLGLPPDQAEKVLGKTLKRDVAQYQNIQEVDVA